MRLAVLALLFVALCSSLAATEKDPALEKARRLLRRTILVDGHNDLPWAIHTSKTAPRDLEANDLRKRLPGDTDLPRLREGGVGAQFWSVYVPAEKEADGYASLQLEQIDLARRMIAKYPEALGLALRASDVQHEFRRGRIASLLGIEGGHVIENSLGALRAYYDLGVRYMTLTHNGTLDWADAAGDERRHGGLTRFGEEVVREMNRLGMIVDLSHTTPETMEDALRVSEAPVLFSHSSARALCDVPRNVPDEILRLLPRNGGVVMVTFVAGFVSQEVANVTGPAFEELRRRTRGVADPAERERIHREIFDRLSIPGATIGQVADHVDHIRRVAGVAHVGLGGDYDGNTLWPEGLEDVSRYPYLFAELIRRGWSDSDLRNLAGRNLLRVMRSVETTAKRLATSRPASTATIEKLDGTPPGR